MDFTADADNLFRLHTGQMVACGVLTFHFEQDFRSIFLALLWPVPNAFHDFFNIFGAHGPTIAKCFGFVTASRRGLKALAIAEKMPRKGASLRLLLPLLLAPIVAATPALAIEQNCRFIQAKPEREACYARQEAELAAKRRPQPTADSKYMETIQQMRREDAEVYRSLRGICRGC